MLDKIKIKGAKQHNLKNVDLEIPKNKFVVFTGISGSGKSSLAFDTIYAEGQRRYVESLSAYARQFLGIMDKPDVESIEGLSPSISIDQKTASHNPRSTVGTITEIYDYLRVLYARVGHPHCPNCKIEISKLSVDEIANRIIELIQTEVIKNKITGHNFILKSPVVRQKKGEFKDLFSNLLSKGFLKIIIDNKELETDTEIELIKTNKHTIEVIIDNFPASYKELKDKDFQARLKTRLVNSIEQSLKLSDGLVILKTETKEQLFSEKFSCPQCGYSLPEIEPRMFSFNSPLGACEECKGIGTIFRIDSDLLLNPNLTINEGGILPFNRFYFGDTWYIRLIKQVAKEEGIDLNKKIEKLPAEKMKILLEGTSKVYEVLGTNRFGKETYIHEHFDGIVKELERRYFNTSSEWSGMEIRKYMREEVCSKCQGDRLKQEVLSITIDQQNIAQFTKKSIIESLNYLNHSLNRKLSDYEKQVAESILKEITTRLNFLNNVGLSYLTIARPAKTLSGGELQRIRLASQIGTGLTGVLYVLDEPSIGLHPKDVSALITSLKNLKELGNTLIVVEHDQETMEQADYLVELGPKAGKNGGEITFAGTYEQMKKSATSLTGQYLSGKKYIENRNKPLAKEKGTLLLKGAQQFNLKNVDLSLPLGNLIAITGVSGSGKSTLITETLYPALKYQLDGYYMEEMGEFQRLEGFQYLDRVYLVDQSPIGRTPRSNPATYVGFFDDIRDMFANTLDAKAKGFNKGRFSFNVKGGRCEKCQGAGVLKIEMQFLADVYVVCDVCKGKRYNHETLAVKFKEKTIYDILKMTVTDGLEFFKNHQQIYEKLLFLKNVGLEYIELGQAAPTFSGGEAQRIKLANELSKRDTGRTLYILDEPTTGLHFYDIEKLLKTFYQLTEKGNTVLVIEHNLDVIKNAQYVVDMGPEGGDKGGEILFQGKTKDLLKVKKSATAEFLKKYY